MNDSIVEALAGGVFAVLPCLRGGIHNNLIEFPFESIILAALHPPGWVFGRLIN